MLELLAFFGFLAFLAFLAILAIGVGVWFYRTDCACTTVQPVLATVPAITGEQRLGIRPQITASYPGVWSHPKANVEERLLWEMEVIQQGLISNPITTIGLQWNFELANQHLD